MTAVGAEGQAEEIALVRVFGQMIVGEIRDLIRVQIQDSDGLMGLIVLCAITIVQERSIASVAAKGDGGRKAIQRAETTWRGGVQELARGERNLARAFIFIFRVFVFGVFDREQGNSSKGKQKAGEVSATPQSVS